MDPRPIGINCRVECLAERRSSFAGPLSLVPFAASRLDGAGASRGGAPGGHSRLCRVSRPIRQSPSRGSDKRLVIVVVVALVEHVGGEDEARRPRRKVFDLAPDHGPQMEAAVGAIQVHPCPLSSVVDDHIEAARYGDQHLVELFVRVACPHCSTRHVIQVIHAADVERYMTRAFNKGQVPPAVVNLGKLDCSVTPRVHTNLPALQNRVLALTLRARQSHVDRGYASETVHLRSQR